MKKNHLIIECSLYQKNSSRSSRSAILFEIIKTINKSIGGLRRDTTLRWNEKKKCGKGSSSMFTEYKKVCAELQVKVLIKKQEFKEELRNLERKLLTKNEGLTISPKSDDKKVYDDIVKSLSYIKAVERGISR